MLSRSCRYHLFDMRFIHDVVSAPVPPNIVEEVFRFDPEIGERLKEYRTADATLVVMMQKREDIPFVPPIDIHTGGVVDDERIRSRYWTVFGGEKPR